MSGIITAAAITAGTGLVGGGLQALTSSKGNTGQYQQTGVQLPQWYSQGRQDVYGRGTQTSYDLPQPTQLGVAPLSAGAGAGIQSLYEMAFGPGGQARNQGWLQGQQMASGIAGYDPTQGDIQKFLNPNEQYSQAALEQQRAQAINRNDSAAIGAYPGSGSRAQVANAATNAQFGLSSGMLSSANWNSALQAALATKQLNLQALPQFASFLGGGQESGIKGATSAIAGQEMLRQNEQERNAAQFAYENALRQDPVDRLQIQKAALGSAPGEQTQFTNQGPGPTGNPFLTGLGTAGVTANLLQTLSGLGGRSGYSDNPNLSNWLTGQGPAGPSGRY